MPEESGGIPVILRPDFRYGSGGSFGFWVWHGAVFCLFFRAGLFRFLSCPIAAGLVSHVLQQVLLHPGVPVWVRNLCRFRYGIRTSPGTGAVPDLYRMGYFFCPV